MRDVTLCYLLKDGQVLLGRKKRGFGEGKLNGYGGKVEDGETIAQGLVRELAEEAGIRAREEDLRRAATIDFTFKDKREWDQRVHVFLLEAWKGTPRETEEMHPVWRPADDLPYAEMWADDEHWLPRVLAGERLAANFTFTADGGRILERDVRPA